VFKVKVFPNLICQGTTILLQSMKLKLRDKNYKLIFLNMSYDEDEVVDGGFRMSGGEDDLDEPLDMPEETPLGLDEDDADPDPDRDH